MVDGCVFKVNCTVPFVGKSVVGTGLGFLVVEEVPVGTAPGNAVGSCVGLAVGMCARVTPSYITTQKNEKEISFLRYVGKKKKIELTT